MQQQFKQPQRGRNRGVYDEEPQGTFPQSLYRQESEPANNGDVSRIDDVLAENDKVMSPQAIAGQESNISGPGSSAPKNNPGGTVYREEDPKGDQNDSKIQKVKAKISGLNKKAKIGIISGSVFGLGSLGLFFGSGSLLLPHLSQILSLDGQQNEKTSNVRLNALYRYARSGGAIGETRVSYLGSKKFHGSIAELEKIGVSFNANEKVGVLKGFSIDKTKFPVTQGLSDDKIPGKLATYFKDSGIDSSNIKINGSTITIEGVDGKNLSISARRAIVNDTINKLDGGKISTWLKARQIKKFYNVPSIFHPFKRIDAKISERIDKIASRAAEKDRKSSKTYESSKRTQAYNNLKESTSGVRAGASAALLVTAATCIARDSANDAITYNREAIVIPQALEAADTIAAGAQQQSGMDFTPGQIASKISLLEDEDGGTIWDSKALQAKTNPNVSTGEDIPPEYSEAFGSAGGAASLSNAGGALGGVACSTAGKITQGAVGAVLLVFAIPSGGGTAAVYSGLKIAGGAAAGAAAIVALQKLITDSLKDEPIPDDIKAPVRGGLLAYGSRELANINARASGGIELSDSESAAIDQRIAADDKAEFQSRSFAARLFDASDYRSVAGTLLRSNSSRTNDLKNMATGLTNIIPTTLGMFKSLSPVASAAETFDYGFNRYGIPESILNNEAYDDPYENADRAAALFKGGSGGDYIERAKKCFGVTIATDSDGLWSVTGENEVNPNSEEYQDANCNDISDKNWVTTFLFVEDSMEMEAAACYLKEEDSCEKLGATDEKNVCSVENGSTVTGFPSWAKMPVVNAQPGGAVSGTVSMAIANIKEGADVAPGIRIMAGRNLDFIGLNEVGETSLQAMENAAPGYGAYRDKRDDGTGQSLGNVIMWKKDKWTMLDSGRVQLVDKDLTFAYGGDGSPRTWSRYAMWGVFKRISDGAIVPVIVTHMMTNPAKFPKQHGNPTMTRIEQYELGMDILIQLTSTLSKYGPVLIAGDMNTQSNQGDWAAVPKLSTLGYNYAHDGAVVYIFNPKGTKITGKDILTNVRSPGDSHPGAVLARIDMNGAGPGSIEGTPTANTNSPGEDCGEVGTVNYKNPVYDGSAPDPSVIKGDDGTYHVYATGNTHLTSKDMVNWKKSSSGWGLKGAPNLAGGAKWAPDIAKVGSKYVFTYTIPTGTPEIGGGGSPKIGYAIGSSAAGPFQYKGTLNLPYPYSIDSHIFVDDDEKPWLFWGGGAINVIQLKLDGETLKTTGSMKQLLTKGGVGSSATIEGAYTVKRDGWYYLTYSQGHFRKSDGSPEYRVLVARSKNVNGPYKPDDSMRPILEGKGDIRYPGHHSIMTDESGKDWIVYHGYYKNESQTRSLMIDPISYENGWPIVNGPTSTTQKGPAVSGISGSNTDSVSMKDDYKAPQCENFRAGGAPGLACDAECVDFVKFRLKKNISRNRFSSLGHGKDVVSGLGTNHGYRVDNKPAVNSVVSWKAGQFGMNSTYGHTAMVSAVNKDGSIVIEEYNVTPGKYTTRKIPANQASQLTYAHTEVDF